MGHIVGKDIYAQLGTKIDSLSIRVPFNSALLDILKELYSRDEAEIIIKMPFVLSDLKRIAKITKYKKSKLQKIFEKLSAKGLVMDFWLKDRYYYMLSPMFVGIFELTMMRTGADANSKKWAKLFSEYIKSEKLYSTNFANNQKFSFIRALPHVETIDEFDHLKILDYEMASSLVERFDRFSIGLCSCRHEKHHLEEKKCATPLDSCTSFGVIADYFIRRNFAKEASKTQILENIARSKELGLVLTADNVKRNITFMCHCCGCCCNVLAGISKYGYPNMIVTSSFIASINDEKCTGCGACAKACTINAIDKTLIEKPKTKKKANYCLNKTLCLGCGVCALKCKEKAIALVRREKRVIYPETTFERVILQSLERDTLQNQLFDNPSSITHKFMRGFLGGFFKLSPIKRALMSNTFRSSFLASMKVGAKMQGKGYVAKL